jgi:hypothetical protein
VEPFKQHELMTRDVSFREKGEGYDISQL